jgi:hypothetical protein
MITQRRLLCILSSIILLLAILVLPSSINTASPRDVVVSETVQIGTTTLLSSDWFELFDNIADSYWHNLEGSELACPVIYNGGNGWIIDMCDSDPEVNTPMAVVLNGADQGDAVLLRVYHKSQGWPGTPQVAVIYASGYIRLKQNADPSPSIPFGTSFVLGPAYWTDLSTHHHNPQLSRLEIDTSWLPSAPLRMRVLGTNEDFDITYEMQLPPPRDRQTRLHVTQVYTATANIDIDPTRQAEHQGFKLVQASSMFINEGEPCDGGYTDCHDSNAARFIGKDLSRHQVAFTDITPMDFVFTPSVSLGSTWLDVLHTDDVGWQGNTPNARIALDRLPDHFVVTPQGHITATTSPNDDNVGLWLNADGLNMQTWPIGRSEQVSYWLIAQDNPPEPWADLGLRSGFTFLDFEGSYNCFPVVPGPHVTGSVGTIAGYADTALQLSYDLDNDNGNWAQVRCDFNPPLDLSAYDHVRFDWRGDPESANSLEIGLIDQVDNTQRIFGRGYHHTTHRGWWGQLVIPFKFLAPWQGGTFDSEHVVAIFVSVVKDGDDDTGGAGLLAIDNLNAYNVAGRTVPTEFPAVVSNTVASSAAVQWLASQQQGTGLLKSWAEESICTAHVYDQALALIAFSHEGRWLEADDIVAALVKAQNPDGSWYKSYNCSDTNLPCVHCHKWEGDIAWAIYALGRYQALGGTHPGAVPAMCNGTRWLAGRVDPDNGCLSIDHTEGTIDAWWAFQAAGYNDEATGIRSCLLSHYWDEEMGRFKGGRDWWQPYLDNQTWGGAFLKAIGEQEDARQALAYARDVLLLPAQGGQVFGLDGQGGPWSVWNEGIGQYVAVGGDGADDLALELLAQQREDGALAGSPDEYSGGGVWTTRWHGVAPTAWLYLALNDEPFHAGAVAKCSCIYLPVVLSDH